MCQQVRAGGRDRATNVRRAQGARSPTCPRAPSPHVHISARRRAVLLTREFVSAGGAAAHTCRRFAGSIPRRKCHLRREAQPGRPAASSSSSLAGGGLQCSLKPQPSHPTHCGRRRLKDAHRSRHFEQDGSAWSHQSLRSAKCHARSCVYCMSRSLASKPSIEHVQCAWHEVRLDLRGAGEAHIACTARDHAAETSYDGRHDDTDESRRLCACSCAS